MDGAKMDLSIIIPVFNTNSESLKRCLDSVIQINELEYEILLIDDGSDNKNSQIYRRILTEEKYKKIRYIKKNNGGVSSSRNLGITESKGNYIMFVDSDDSIDAQVLEKKYFKLDADLIIFNSYIIKEDSKYIQYELEAETGIIHDASILINNFILRNTLHGPCWKLYKREFLLNNKIRFNENIIQGEDAIFNLEVIEKVQKIYNTKEILYNYFYDYKTTDERWKKNPCKMIENLRLNYNKEVKASDKLKTNNNIKKKIKEKYLDEIFTAYLILLKEYDRNEIIESLNKLFEFFQILNIDKRDIRGVKKIKYILVFSKRWDFLKILSIFRKVYLDKIKK